MKTVVVTDAKYRSAIPVCRALARAGYYVVALQTRPEATTVPAAFFSKYVSKTYILENSAKSEEYTAELIDVLKEYDNPVLFCIGADTLRAVAKNTELFENYAQFLISDIKKIDLLNDKEAVAKRAAELSIPTPIRYFGVPDKYPAVVKLHCGEKFGLEAGERYAVVNNAEEFKRVMSKMQEYEPDPIVQEKVDGEGRGACLLIDKDGRLINAVCHKRVREYYVLGGPSACCESFYDNKMVDDAYRLLRSFDFCGMAMVEFKGKYLLEVNPRLWGSYPLTECVGSRFSEYYAKAAEGEVLSIASGDYKKGVRMHFIFNDMISVLRYLRAGKIKSALSGVLDIFRAKEALFDIKDAKPFFVYLKNNLIGK